MPDIVRTLQEHLRARKLREQSKSMEDKYKKLLMDELEAHGEEDDAGHRWFFFREQPPVIDDEMIVSIKRERRTSLVMDEDAAESKLKELGLLEKCQETVVVLDEDKILSLNYEGELPDDVLQSFYTEKVSYAFKVDKEKLEDA